MRDLIRPNRWTAGLLLMLVTLSLPGADWVAPAEAAAVANPVASTPAALSQAAALYTKDCAYCHGAGGKGDGPSGVYLSPKPGDFTNPAMWGESDGALFWKISTGRTTMPAFKTFTTSEQRWMLVLYIRTLAPKPASPAAAPAAESPPHAP